jgi:hypothetical protein
MHFVIIIIIIIIIIIGFLDISLHWVGRVSAAMLLTFFEVFRPRLLTAVPPLRQTLARHGA